MNIVVKNPIRFQRRLSGPMHEVANVVRSMNAMFERLNTLKDDCVMMKTCMDGWTLVLAKDGDCYVLGEEDEITVPLDGR